MAKAKETEAKAKEKEAPTKSIFGHKPNAMSGTIDELVAEGVTLKDAVKKLMKQFERDEKGATAKFLAHIRHLETDRGITVNFDEEKGFYKAVQK